jgi:hypothetical protein
MTTLNDRYPVILTERTLSVIVDSEMYHVPRPDGGDSMKRWDALKAALNNPNTTDEEMLALVQPAKAIERALVDPTTAKATAGKVELRDGALYYDGEQVNSVLADRILDIVSEGLDVMPWVRFAENIFANPAAFSRDELYLFLENASLPITSDGCFWAYKNVREDYTDIATGTFDNSIGAICEMAREEVDANRYRTCSAGLHFCSKEYLPHFSHHADGHTMIVKINPSDVVSIPADYNNSKGRCWRYEVVGEIPATRAATHEWPPIVESDTVLVVSDKFWNQPSRIAEEATIALADLERPTSRFKRWLRRS